MSELFVTSKCAIYCWPIKNKKLKVLVFTGTTPSGSDGGAGILRQYLQNKKFVPTYLVLSKNKKQGIPCFFKIDLFKIFFFLCKTCSFEKIFSRSYWITCTLFSSSLCIPKSIHPQSFDYFYTWGGDSIWVKKVIELSELYNVPIILHLMDNHFEPHKNRLLMPELERIQLNKKLIHKAFKIFVISKKMQKYIYKKFKKQSLIAPVLPENRISYSGKKKIDKTFNIGWFGSLDDSQKNGIVQFIKGCQGLTTPVKLTAFVARREDWNKLPAYVKVKKHPFMQSHNSINKSLSQLNALLLAYDFSNYTKIHYKFSLPAKLSFFLKTKLPIIAFGPKSIYPIEILRKNKFGSVINTPKPRQICKNIIKIMKKPKAFLNQRNKMKILKTHFKTAILDV